MPERAFIAIGSNIDPEKHLPLAVGKLNELGTVVATSRVYQNPAIGPGPQPDFLNAAVLVRTDLPPIEIRRRLRAIEMSLGRVRGSDKYVPRTIDLDLCLYGTVVLTSSELTIPGPEVTERAYLAVALGELAPDMPHPITGELLADLANRLRTSAQLIPRSDIVLLA